MKGEAPSAVKPEVRCAHDAIVEVASLVPNPRNPNKHPAEQLRIYAKVLLYQGWRKAIVVSNQSGKIVTGVGAYLTCIAEGWPSAPVDYQDFENAADEMAHLLADNRLPQMSELDGVALAKILEEELPGWDLELIGGPDLQLSNAINGDTQPQIDRAAELREEWKTESGQIWQLGEHRLLCGDCTKAEDVARVMDGKKAHLIFTDPPYNVSYQNNESIESLKARNRRTDGAVISNDAMSDEQFDVFLDSFLNHWPLRDGGAYYVCAPAGRTETQFRFALHRVSGLEIRQCIVWVKDVFVFGRQDYHWRHESILYGWREGAAHYFVDDHTQDTDWNIDRPSVSPDHPTTKPVELSVRAIKNSSKTDELVFDGFLGSGTTLIACENLQRRCFAMEIDPGYVAVTLQRWADHTGKTPVLLA